MLFREFLLWVVSKVIRLKQRLSTVETATADHEVRIAQLEGNAGGPGLGWDSAVPQEVTDLIATDVLPD